MYAGSPYKLKDTFIVFWAVASESCVTNHVPDRINNNKALRRFAAQQPTFNDTQSPSREHEAIVHNSLRQHVPAKMSFILYVTAFSTIPHISFPFYNT